MTALLNRQVALTVGTTAIVSSGPTPERPITALRVAFGIDKTLLPEPNNAEIAIWNLSEEKRKAFDEKRQTASLAVGYGAGLFQLFRGTVVYAASQRQGTDWVTKLNFQDGTTFFRASRINVSLGAGTTIGTALQKVAQALGLPTGNLSSHLTPARGGVDVFSRGVVLSGSAQENLSKLLKTAGYEWSIQDGQIQVLAPTETAPGLVVKLSPDSGLIGSPERSKDGYTKARALIQPDLLPGCRVVLESDVVNGAFRIEKARYVGDTFDTDWYVDIEAKPI